MTHDNSMAPNTPYVINKAYMALRDNGVKADLDWMQRLRVITETQLATYAENAELRRERNLCINTVKQLQDKIDELRDINRRYGDRILNTDKTINDVMQLLEEIPEDYANTLDDSYRLLDKALCDFPRELIKEE